MRDEVYSGNKIGFRTEDGGLTVLGVNDNLQVSNFTYTNNFVTSKKIGLISISDQLFSNKDITEFTIESFNIQDNE